MAFLESAMGPRLKVKNLFQRHAFSAQQKIFDFLLKIERKIEPYFMKMGKRHEPFRVNLTHDKK